MTYLIRSLGLGTIAACIAGATTQPTEIADDLRSGFVLVANQQSSNVSLIDLRTDSARLIAVPPGPHEAVISPSGKTWLVTIYGIGQPGNQLVVIDIASASITKTISLGEYTRPHGAGFMPGDESRAVVTSETTQRVVIVDLKTGMVLNAIPTEAAGSHMVAITADGKRAFTSNVGTGGTSEVDLANAKFVRAIAIAPRVEGIAVVPNGSTVWAGSNTSGTVSIIDTRSGQVVDTLSGLGMPYRLAASADNKLVMICDPQGDHLYVADVATRKVIWSLSGIGSPRGVNIAPDGKTAFVTLAADETMGVVDLEKRAITRKIRVGTSPDGVWYGPAPRN